MKIKTIYLWDEQVAQIKEWKLKHRRERIYLCPFKMSAIGGKICAKAFRKCNHNPDKYPPIVKRDTFCFTTPCPCGIYTFPYVMRKASIMIKYRKI